MGKHTGMPAQINGENQEKSPSWPVKDRDATCETRARWNAHLWRAQDCAGRALLALWLHFAYTFGFTHSKRKGLWQGGSLVAFGKALQANWTRLLLPQKMQAILSRSSAELSCFNPCSENCEAVIATPGLILQWNIFQGMFFNKNTFARPPVTKEIKEKA